MTFSFLQKILAWFRMVPMRVRGVEFGSNVYVGKNTTISKIHNLQFGSNIYIGKNVTIEVEGEVGDNCLIANNVGIVGRLDHDYRQAGVDIFHADTVRANRGLSFHTVIGDDVWLGYGSVVLSGVSIGSGAIVAAGSIVTRDVKPNTIVAGNPASVVSVRRR